MEPSQTLGCSGSSTGFRPDPSRSAPSSTVPGAQNGDNHTQLVGMSWRLSWMITDVKQSSPSRYPLNVGVFCLQQLLTNYQHLLNPEIPASYSKPIIINAVLVLAGTSFQFWQYHPRTTRGHMDLTRGAFQLGTVPSLGATQKPTGLHFFTVALVEKGEVTLLFWNPPKKAKPMENKPQGHWR